MSIPNSHLALINTICVKYEISKPKLYVERIRNEEFECKVDLSSMYYNTDLNRELFEKTQSKLLFAHG